MSLLQMSISSGFLIIAIVLIRAAAKNRLPKTAFLVLWGVALLRLLVPVAAPAWFSFTSSDNTAPLVNENMLFWVIPGEAAVNYQSVVAQGQVNIPFVIWLVGMVGLLIFFAVVYFRNHQKLRFATLIRNDFLDEWLAENRLTRPIAIMQSDRIATPLAVGLLRPRIILPKNMDMSDKQLLSHVLMHEYYHIKRFDALWKILMVCAVCVHWFNPLVWVMLILASRDLELTCDEMVIRHFGTETKTAYAYSIISMAEQRSKFASLYNGFSRNAAKERIESIMKMKRKSIVSLAIACVMVVTLTIGTLTAFASEGHDDERTPQPFPAGRAFHIENYERLYEWLERFQSELPRNRIRLFPGGTPEEGFRFESIEALREFLGEDVEVTFVPLDEVPDIKNIGDWAELLAELGIGGNATERTDALPFDGFRLLPRYAEGLRKFASLDALREYFGEEVNFFSANTPLLSYIYGMDEFIIYWQGEFINILADAEIYSMIQDGATLTQIMNVITAR